MSVSLRCVQTVPVGYEPVIDSCVVLQRKPQGKERGTQRSNERENERESESERENARGPRGETSRGQPSRGTIKNNGKPSDPSGFLSDGVRDMYSDQYSSCPSAQNSVGTLLRRARLRRTMTTQELANASGVEAGLIEQIENGTVRFPPNEVLTTLSASLDAHLHAGIAEPN